MIGSLANLDENARGIIITNNSFSNDAINKASLNSIELIDGDKLLNMITKLD
jgi:HJR/Mrr/RecB family endonuclease